MTIQEAIDYLADEHCKTCAFEHEGECCNDDSKCFEAKALAINALYTIIDIKRITKDLHDDER